MKLNFPKSKQKKSKQDREDASGETNVRFAVSAQNVQKALQHWKWRLLNMRLKDSITRLSALAIVAAGSWGVANAAEAPETAKEDGYFLSLDQKAELINEGEITGADGTRYDVRVVPGYKPTVDQARDYLVEAKDTLVELPTHYQKSVETAADHVSDAGESFSRYGEAEHYAAIGDTYEGGTEFIVDEMARKMIIEGISESWSDSMSHATETTRNQVIGWPLAFPWAVTKSTVETAGRLTLGTVGIASGAVGSYALLPFGQMAAPAAMGTFEGIGGGIVRPIVEIAGRTALATTESTLTGVVGGVGIPAVKTAWNTTVAPPLALAGRMPTESRADGYFVRVLPNTEAAPSPAPEIQNELSQMSEELASPERISETASVNNEGGCCAIFTEIINQQMAYAMLDARASIPQ